jgi:hypothetical protein
MTETNTESSDEHSLDKSPRVSDPEAHVISANLEDSRKGLEEVVNSEALLSIDEISKVRSEKEKLGRYRVRKYEVDDTSVSILRPPVLASEIRDDEHKQRILSVLQCQEEGEAECYERFLVNILREQARIAKKFELPEKGLYLSMKLNYIDDGIMMDNFGDIYMQTMARQIDSLKKQGATDEEIVTELSGHVFHEAVHQGENGLGEALHEGSFALGEVTTITAQLAYYLEKGYKGPKSYGTSRLKQGLKKIRAGEDSPIDHEIATCVSSELLLKHLKGVYSDISDGTEHMNALDACETIVFRIPSDKRAELIPCLKRAIAESADDAVFKRIVEQLKS